MTLGFPPWRREALRTTLWVVPSGLLVAAVALFAVTYHVDYRVYDGAILLPSWARIESPDGARQLLSALAAGVITVLGVVFSVTIVALTLRVAAVRPANAAQLHQGPRYPDHAGQLRSDPGTRRDGRWRVDRPTG